MKHIIIGGDGFVGRYLSADLAARGEQVLVADIVKSGLPVYNDVAFQNVDVTKPEEVAQIDIGPDDVVYNMSAKMLSPLMPRAKRRDFFWPVNHDGVVNILAHMERSGASRLVHFTTDMVYGHSQSVPQTEDHPKAPLGEYGLSKLATEGLCDSYREKGMSISLFRPRLIIGPGRLGILTKLFKLVDLNLPVPMIGGGHNPYQFISVYDCASAARLAWEAGLPNSDYNIGSDDPPSVRKLLRQLIDHAGSRSILLPTPAPLVKKTLDAFDWLNMPIMDPEQYLIADEVCILDCSKAKRELGWQPQHRDEDMLIAAYDEYRRGRGVQAQSGGATTLEGQS